MAAVPALVAGVRRIAVVTPRPVDATLVVARELGLPTIVGVSGGLMKRLKTGMRVRVDAGKGEIRILGDAP